MRGVARSACLVAAGVRFAREGFRSRRAATSRRSSRAAARASTVPRHLRCFEHACRRTARSAVGDYFAALGAQLRAKGDVEGAIDAYNRALGHYDTEKIALPPDVDCAYGAALAAGKTSKEHAELAARVLHRCMLAVPVGSHLREQALADAATLADAGLDPLALGRNALADVYLTRAPQKPTTDKLQVSRHREPAAGRQDLPADPRQARRARHEVRARRVLGCVQRGDAQGWRSRSRSASSRRTSRRSTRTRPAGSRRSSTRRLRCRRARKPPPMSCVRAAVEPALKGLALKDAFATKLTITVK